LRLLIDADPIVYRVGFANEQKLYVGVAKDALGNLHNGMFARTETKSALKNLEHWVAENDLDLLDKQTIVQPGPISHTLHSVKVQLEAIDNAVSDWLKRENLGRITETSIVLSGPGNYRDAVATIAPYKGNRDPDHKPYHYQTIRDYLVERYGAYVVHGREADDEVSIRARELGANGAAIATIDKDLDQIPGLHYDYMQKVVYVVTEEDARRAFWYQALLGDVTDNIPGCWKVGPAKAAKIIDQAIAKNVSDNDLWEVIKFAYELSTKVAGCPYTDGAAAALETARLVYLQQMPRELWTPPGSPKEWLAGEVE
jgi:hypothetical protein